MKKKNKVISLIVVLSLCFSFTVIPANAVNPYAVVRPPDVGGGGETSDPYEGQFFIQNCESQTFMQIDDNASYSEQSAKMELWPFDGTSIQGWEITNLDNGYYKIVSKKADWHCRFNRAKKIAVMLLWYSRRIAVHIVNSGQLKAEPLAVP